MSKVRSTTLDVQAWDAPTVAMFEALGNIAANAAFEARIYDARGAAARDDIFFSNTFEQVCCSAALRLSAVMCMLGSSSSDWSSSSD